MVEAADVGGATVVPDAVVKPKEFLREVKYRSSCPEDIFVMRKNGGSIDAERIDQNLSSLAVISLDNNDQKANNAI